MNLWLIPILPLIGFLLNGLFGKRLSRPVVSLIAVGSVAASFAYVLLVLSKAVAYRRSGLGTLLHLDSKRLPEHRL